MKTYNRPEIEVISFASKNDMMAVSINSAGKNDNVIGIWELDLPNPSEIQ